MIRNCSRSVVVDVSVERAYEIWSDFTRIPSFAGPVDEVRVEGERLFWKVGGTQWEAVVTEQTPNERLSWRRIEGPGAHTVVSFVPAGGGRVKVILGSEYEVAPGEKDGRATRFEQVLEGFKTYAERGGPGPFNADPVDSADGAAGSQAGANC